MTWYLLLSYTVLLLAAGAIGLALYALKSLPPLAQSANKQLDSPVSPAPWIIYNPRKIVDFNYLKLLVNEVVSTYGITDPLWVETTPEDTGAAQALQAVQAQAPLVISVGGDGTVKAVASALRQTKIPLGIVPCGTGNLLARNLALPLGDLPELVRIAFTGSIQSVDLGWLRFEGTPAKNSPAPEGHLLNSQPAGNTSVSTATPKPTPMPTPQAPKPDEYAFLIMGGVGFDAAVMSATDDELKVQIGWLAYVVAGFQQIRSPRIRGKLTIDNVSQRFQARSVIAANAGNLTSGFILVPAARIDDGWLDIAVADTRAGFIGWLALVGKVIIQGFHLPVIDFSRSAGKLNFFRAKQATVKLKRATPVQVDGDLIGVASKVVVRVEENALQIRSC